MNVIRRIGPCTVAQVREQLQPGRVLAYTSVSTIIRILEQKGHLLDGRALTDGEIAEVKALLITACILLSILGRVSPRKAVRSQGENGGPAWIRTKDQGIHVIEAFPPRVDYLFTRRVSN
jgi:hypothetical protein